MPRGGFTVDPLGCVDQAAHARQSCGIKHMRDFHHNAAVSTPCNNAAIPRSRSAFMGEPRNQCSALSMNAGVPVSRTRATHARAVSTSPFVRKSVAKVKRVPLLVYVGVLRCIK